MPENIEQVYRGRLGTLCSANIDHRFHHSICHGATTLNGLISPSSHLNDRQSTKFSIRKNMFSVCSSSWNANPTARLPPPTTPTSLHLSSPLSTQSCKSACRSQPPPKSQHNRTTNRPGFLSPQSGESTRNPQPPLKSPYNRSTVGPENIEQVYRGTRQTSRPNCSPIVSGFQGRFRIAAGFKTDPPQTLKHAELGHRR